MCGNFKLFCNVKDLGFKIRETRVKIFDMREENVYHDGIIRKRDTTI